MIKSMQLCLTVPLAMPLKAEEDIRSENHTMDCQHTRSQLRSQEVPQNWLAMTMCNVTAGACGGGGRD